MSSLLKMNFEFGINHFGMGLSSFLPWGPKDSPKFCSPVSPDRLVVFFFNYICCEAYAHMITVSGDKMDLKMKVIQ